MTELRPCAIAKNGQHAIEWQAVRANWNREEARVFVGALCYHCRKYITVHSFPTNDEEAEHEPHDLACENCGVILNNQCLDPACTETEAHVSTDLLCANCQTFINPQPHQRCTETWHNPAFLIGKGDHVACRCGHEFSRKDEP